MLWQKGLLELRLVLISSHGRLPQIQFIWCKYSSRVRCFEMASTTFCESSPESSPEFSPESSPPNTDGLKFLLMSLNLHVHDLWYTPT